MMWKGLCVGMTVAVASSTTAGMIQASASSANVVNITFETEETGPALTLEQGALKAFESQHPNIHVSFVVNSNKYYVPKLLTELANGSAPDVFFIEDSNANEFASSGQIQNLTPLERSNPNFSQDLHHMFPRVLDIGKFNNKLYLVPKDWASEAVLYNKSLFDKAHLPYPTSGWTWSEFVKDAKKLTIVQNGRNQQWGAQLPGDWLRAGVEEFVASWGGSILSPSGKTANGYLNSKKSKQALNFYLNLYKKDNIAPNPSDISSFGNVDLFQTGKVAMELTGPWLTSQYIQDKNFRFGVSPMPVGPAGKPVSQVFWAGFAVNAHSKNLTAADELVAFFASKQWALADGKYSMPARQDVANSESLKLNPNLKVFFDEAKNIAPLQVTRTLNWNNDVQKPLINMVDGILTSGSSGVNISQQIDQTTQQIDTNLTQTMANKQ